MENSMTVSKLLELLKSYHQMELSTSKALETVYWNHYNSNYGWYNKYFSHSFDGHIHTCVDVTLKQLINDFENYNSHDLIDYESKEFVNFSSKKLTDFGQYVVDFIGNYMTISDEQLDVILLRAIETTDRKVGGIKCSH